MAAPESRSKISLKVRAAPTGGTIAGRYSRVRNSPRARIGWLTSTASSSPAAMDSGTVIATKTPVRAREDIVSGSVRTSR